MVKVTIDVPQDVLDEWNSELDKQGKEFQSALRRLMRGDTEAEESGIKEWYVHNLLEAYQARNYIQGHHPNQYVRGRGPQPKSTGPKKGHVQTGESEGVAPGEIPPWELKAPATQRYEGDPGAVYSPAERHHRTGRYALGRRIQGTALSKDPTTEVSLHMFIPESATTFERKHFEDMIVSHSDHAQTHAGHISYNTAKGFQHTPGDNYYIRGNYKNIEELGNQIAPQLRSTYGDNQHVKIMTNQTPSGIPIKSGKTIEHLRVVVPFKAGTPKNTVGERVLSNDQVTALSKELSGPEHRAIVTHLDFNGMHLAISGEKEDMNKVASMLEKKGYHNKADHEYGATRFVPTDVTYERYPITAVDAIPDTKVKQVGKGATPKKVSEWLKEDRSDG